MSHVVGSSSEVYELDCFIEALKLFPKLKFHKGKRTYNWYQRYLADYSGDDAAFKLGIDPSQYGTCEHAVHMDGVHYQIGLMKGKGGGLAIVWDFYADGINISNYIGKGAEKLLTEYHRQVAMKHANEKGWTYHEEGINEDGELVVELIPNQY